MMRRDIQFAVAVLMLAVLLSAGWPAAGSQPKIGEPNTSGIREGDHPANVPAVSSPSVDPVRAAQAELRAEFYEKASESLRREIDSYRREIDNLKWFVTLMVALAGVFIAYLGYSQKRDVSSTTTLREFLVTFDGVFEFDADGV